MLAAEWHRLRRRPALAIVVVAIVGLTALAYGLGLSSALGSRGLGNVPDEVMAQRIAPFGFPQSGAAALQNAQLLLVALLAYLSATTVAGDFMLGTIRTSLLARHDRAGFILARLAALAAVAFVLCVVVTLLGLILPWVATLVGADLPAAGRLEPAAIAAYAAAVLLVGLVVIALASFVAMVTKNAGLPILFVGVLFFVESAVASATATLSGPIASVAYYFPLTSVRTLADRAQLAASDISLVPGAPGIPSHAPGVPVLALVGMAWIVLACVANVWFLRRADIDA